MEVRRSRWADGTCSVSAQSAETQKSEVDVVRRASERRTAPWLTGTIQCV